MNKYFRNLNIYKYLRNKIANSTIYWKYRHLIKPDVWNIYLKDKDNPARKHYVKFCINHNIKSVFEFGSASGPNILLIEKLNPNIIALGYDINKKAVELGNKNRSNNQIKFVNKLSLKTFRQFMNSNNINSFELSIYDRVLCLLNEERVTEHFNLFSNFFLFIIVDDFHSLNPKKFSSYKERNYVDILEKFNFKLIEDKPSPRESPNNSARRLTFKKYI